VKNAERVAENVRLFDGWMEATGARAALYLTWARKHEPQNQPLITAAYTSIAKELGATLIPAGVAWQAFRAKHATPELYDKDGSHPTLAGSFLAACVAFEVLFGRSSAGLEIKLDGLTAEEIALLQSIAAATAKSHRSRR